MQVIGVDSGRQGVKAVTEGNRRIFIPSVVGEWRKRKISEGGDYEVLINGQQYFVGELAAMESRFRREMTSRSKIHEETRVLTITAIALLATPGEEIRIVTGLPVDQHILEIKQEYTRLLSGCHTIKINDGPQREIVLTDNGIAITIEGAGAYWSEVLRERKFSGKFRVLDLGSRTINALTINGTRFVDVDSFNLDYGCLEVQNACNNPNDGVAEQLARRIYAELSQRWMDLNDELVLLAGGGALLMEQWLTRHFKGAQILEDPVYANALGYYLMGKAKWQKQS